MKLSFDFATHQSLGNVHDDNTKDNFKSFENAKTLYKSDKELIEKSIIDCIDNLGDDVTNGSKISIPVGHHINSGLINNLEFEVTTVNEDGVNLSLSNVIHKTPATK
jgi:hypothetical protein